MNRNQLNDLDRLIKDYASYPSDKKDQAIAELRSRKIEIICNGKIEKKSLQRLSELIHLVSSTPCLTVLQGGKQKKPSDTN
jgi:hypothetical protein